MQVIKPLYEWTVGVWRDQEPIGNTTIRRRIRSLQIGVLASLVAGWAGSHGISYLTAETHLDDALEQYEAELKEANRIIYRKNSLDSATLSKLQDNYIDDVRSEKEHFEIARNQEEQRLENLPEHQDYVRQYTDDFYNALAGAGAFGLILAGGRALSRRREERDETLWIEDRGIGLSSSHSYLTVPERKRFQKHKVTSITKTFVSHETLDLKHIDDVEYVWFRNTFKDNRLNMMIASSEVSPANLPEGYDVKLNEDTNESWINASSRYHILDSPKQIQLFMGSKNQAKIRLLYEGEMFPQEKSTVSGLYKAENYKNST